MSPDWLEKGVAMIRTGAACARRQEGKAHLRRYFRLVDLAPVRAAVVEQEQIAYRQYRQSCERTTEADQRATTNLGVNKPPQGPSTVEKKDGAALCIARTPNISKKPHKQQ